MVQDGMEKPERNIIEAQKEMMQTLDNYIEHKKKIIEEYKKEYKKE